MADDITTRLEQELRDRIVSIHQDPDEPHAFRKIILTLELFIAETVKKDRFFITWMKIDFSDDFSVMLMGQKNRPPKWELERLAAFIDYVYNLIVMGSVFIYEVTIRYDGVPLFGIGEHPESRKSCYDMRQIPRSKDYFHQIKASQIPEATSI